MKTDGSRGDPAYESPGAGRWGRVVSDGKRIACTTVRDNPLGDICVMNADGTGVVRLTFGPGMNAAASMNADATGVTQLTSNTTVDAYPAWSRRPANRVRE